MALIRGLAIVTTAALALATAAPAAWAALDEKKVGDKCKKAAERARTGDGKMLECREAAKKKTWTLTGQPVAEVDLPGDKPNPSKLYAGRPDTQKEDQERSIGQPARLTGRTIWVLKASTVARLSS